MITYLKVLIYLTNIFIRLKGLDIPEEIYDLCPNSNICNRNASSTFESDGFSSCCASCSCDEECGIRLDCCFDELDNYRLVEIGKVACVKPFYKFSSDNILETSAIQNYYMEKACAAGDDGKSAACRLTDESGNSLLSPVSSLDTNSIYVNLECAMCNDLNSSIVKQWNLLLFSGIVPVDQSITFFFEESVINNSSSLVFVPPFEENWSHKICYDKYIEVKDCKISKEFQTMCTNLRAPFKYQRSMFRNIFCVLCAEVPSSMLSNFCESRTDKGPVSWLTILLNVSVIQTSKLLHSVSDTNIAIKIHDICPPGYIVYKKEKCLKVFCPEGMIETPDGCAHLALRWYTQFITLQIKLLPAQGTALPVSLLPTNGTRETANPLIWLRIPCRKVSLNVVEVYVSTADPHRATEEHTRNNYVTSFIVRLTKKVDMAVGIDPAVAVPIFKKCFVDNWTVKSNKKTYLFEANLDKHSLYVQDGRQTLSKFPLQSKMPFEDFARPALYKLLAEGPRKSKELLIMNEIRLKKPFFCDQVHIPADDVIVGFGEIRILSRNISLGTNEYIVNEPLLDGNINVGDVNKTTFAVCVDDFDQSYKENSMNRNRAVGLYMLYMLIFYMMSLLFA